MIAELDRTIEQVLTAELPIRNGEIDVKFDQPKREWSARLARPTINFFLYDVRENNILRQHQWERAIQGNGRIDRNMAHQKRTPFRVDCHYMMTAWAAEPQDEHRLLTRCLLALFRHPILPKAQLVGSLQDQPYDLQARLANHDRLTNPAEVWSSLDNELRPSISYIITLALDPWTEVSGPVVHTLTLQTGQSEDLPQTRQILDGTEQTTILIGGTVTSGDTPLSGIEVAVKGTGQFSTTDAEGKFTLGSLPAGDYTLVAWPAEGKPKERSISVPAAEYDIELG
jgi:hypothetical protein